MPAPASISDTPTSPAIARAFGGHGATVSDHAALAANWPPARERRGFPSSPAGSMPMNTLVRSDQTAGASRCHLRARAVRATRASISFGHRHVHHPDRAHPRQRLDTLDSRALRLSDATEIFVFLSGIASAIAFGSTFDRAGVVLGTARILQRIWQVYWAHVCVLCAVVGPAGLVGTAPDGRLYTSDLNLQHFLADPAGLTAHFLTLTYVPNYFGHPADVPGAAGDDPAHGGAGDDRSAASAGGLLAIWLPAQFNLLNLPAEPWSDRVWFFDPFGWQFCSSSACDRRGALARRVLAPS